MYVLLNTFYCYVLWKDVVKAGLDKDNRHKKSNRILVSLWQQLKPVRQFQPITASTVAECSHIHGNPERFRGPITASDG